MRHSWVMSASSTHDSIASGSGAADTTALNELGATDASGRRFSTGIRQNTNGQSRRSDCCPRRNVCGTQNSGVGLPRGDGSAPPSNTDRTVPLGRVLAWAALGSATAAVIEVVAFRSMARFFGE